MFVFQWSTVCKNHKSPDIHNIVFDLEGCIFNKEILSPSNGQLSDLNRRTYQQNKSLVNELAYRILLLRVLFVLFHEFPELDWFNGRCTIVKIAIKGSSLILDQNFVFRLVSFTSSNTFSQEPDSWFASFIHST